MPLLKFDIPYTSTIHVHVQFHVKAISTSVTVYTVVITIAYTSF